MDASVIVNIILSILSFILAAISVITVVITLRQNSKMIDNSTRPYVVIYPATTNFQSPNYYICVKNFGQSGATVTSFTCDYELKNCSYDENYIPFAHLKGTFLAPGQSYVASVDPDKIFHEVPKVLTFSISYTANGKVYSDVFNVNIAADSDLIHIRANTTGKELRTISYALQDISEKLL